MGLSKLKSLAGERDLDSCRCVIELYFLSLSHPFRSHARDEPLSSGFQASVSTYCILLSEGKERLYHEGVEDG